MVGVRRLCPFGVLLVLAAGCASSGLPPEVLRSWVGRPATALTQDWGTPTREIADGDQRILVYEELERKRTKKTFDEADAGPRVRGTYDIAQATANTVYRAPTVYVRSYLFWVSRDGTILHAEVRTP